MQGDRREEPEVVAQVVGFKSEEGLVELPEALVDLLARMYVKENYGIDLGVGAAGDDQPDHP
ncbi:hypothetical protein [Actinocorallia sp. A-T 12471]|uniref:hypothetical protein n=1 Tax=Actinocorallia sp. A-T 12471 TaxID=3089813 RepID=UPI0029D1F163|nr:hypothetical protein [Actinocorallia sp. A-T 12471]MDX6738943.1 hypothetical protein [Actinocorallia sp. A-T 12471]